MQNTKASLRYAKAVFETAKEKGCADPILTDLTKIGEIINEKKELFSLIHNPTINQKKKLELFARAFESGLNTITMNFLTLVFKKGREPMLSQIITRYKELYNEEKGIVLAEIIASKPLSEETKKRIKQKINPKGSVDLKETIDKSILGGFVINSGDLQYDSSIRKKINNVKRAFKL